jgi:spore germination protein GerM
MVKRTALALLLIFIPPLIWWVAIRPIPTEVTVYFVRQVDGESTLAPVRRSVRARSAQTKLREAYRALLAGPTAEERAAGLTSEIPPGTALRGIATAGGVVVADFSSEVEGGGGSSSMQERVWQIVYTGTQFSSASRVRIVIDGRLRKSLGGEGLLIEEPIARPAEIPRF